MYSGLPQRKVLTDNANGDSSWQGCLQTPSFGVSEHKAYVGERHSKVLKENHSDFDYWEAERFLWKHWSVIWYWFVMNKEGKDCEERFALQWSWCIVLWYTRSSCGTLSTENSTPTGGRALERQGPYPNLTNSSEVQAKWKQYCSVISFSFTDWVAEQEKNADVCSHIRAVRPRVFPSCVLFEKRKSISLLLLEWAVDGVACLSDLSSFSFSLYATLSSLRAWLQNSRSVCWKLSTWKGRT